MKKMSALAAVVFMILVATVSIYAQGGYTYQNNIRPVLNNHCQWCHSFMGNYESLMEQKSVFPPMGIFIVSPGLPDSSVIVWRLEGKLPGGESIIQMPRFEDPLPEETILMIRQWIASGAPKDPPVGVRENTWGGIKQEYR